MRCTYFLVGLIVLIGLNSCKKDSAPPAKSATIVGKWLVTKQVSEFLYNGHQVDSVKKTTFTSDDFVQYDSDGTGYYSRSSSNGPSLSKFNYTVSGSVVTEYYSAENEATKETITILTQSSLSIHTESSGPDPNNPNATDTEIDNFTYSR